MANREKKRFWGARAGTAYLALLGSVWLLAALGGIDAITTMSLEGPTVVLVRTLVTAPCLLLYLRDWAYTDDRSHLEPWMVSVRAKGKVAWRATVAALSMLVIVFGVVAANMWLYMAAQYLDGPISAFDAVVVAVRGSTRLGLCQERVALTAVSDGERFSVCNRRAFRDGLSREILEEGQIVRVRFRQTVVGKVALGVQVVIPRP